MGFGRYLAMLYDAAGFSSGVGGHIGRKGEILPSFDSRRRQVRQRLILARKVFSKSEAKANRGIDRVATEVAVR